MLLLTRTDIDIGYGNVGRLDAILKTAGVFAFLTTLTGWYLFIVLMFGSTGIPFQLPIVRPLLATRILLTKFQSG